MCSPDLLDAMGAYASSKRGEEAREKRGLLLRETGKKGEGKKREGGGKDDIYIKLNGLKTLWSL